MPATARPAPQMHADPALVRALARAFQYQRLLDDGQYGSTTEMAATEKLDRGYMGRLLQLTLLAPNLIEDVLLNGRGGVRCSWSFRVSWSHFPRHGSSNGRCLAISPRGRFRPAPNSVIRW